MRLNIDPKLYDLDAYALDNEYVREHTAEAIKQRGEVFTPTPLVNEMLDKLPKDVFHDPEKTFLDNSCGNGQFLAAVLERKIASGIEHHQALKTIYGVDIDQKNITECKQRLSMGNDNPAIWEILNHNIICADALNTEHIGWSEIGYMWDESKKIVDLVEAGFFTFEDDIVGT
jgi:type I restriction-modification system DNA methylase subunit